MNITSWLRTIFIRELWKIVKQTSEPSERVSLAILHNEWIIKVVQTNQPSNKLFIIWV